MVICVQADGLGPEFLLENVRPELQRLRDACKATASAEQVALECNASQERLQALLGNSPERTAEKNARTETRQRFLDCADLGPDRQGLLRVFHELNDAIGQFSQSSKAAKTADLRPRHLRVPLCADPSRSSNQALLLWTAFLRCALPQGSPLLMLSRNGVDWLDAVIGEPVSDAFFCLQASPKALPLATAIPYEVSPELKPRLQQLETKFLGHTAPPIAPGSSAPHMEAASVPKTDSPAAAAPLPPTGSTADPSPQPPRSGPRYGLFFSSAVLAVILGVGAYVFMLRQRQEAARMSAAPTQSMTNTPRAAPLAVQATEASATKLVDNKERSDKSREVITAGKKALEQKNYTQATQRFSNALTLVPDDPEARELLGKAQQEELQARLESERESRFAQAIASAKEALDANRFEAAQTELQKAISFKPNDPRVVAN
jgi:tetratricopeptide (TPR) repeat protein